MADDKKNIGPEAEKPGEVPQEKKLEPIKDTPPAPEQPAPGTPQAPVVETAPKAPPAPTVESKPEEKAAPAPKVLDFSAAKNKAPAKEETAPEKKPVKEQTEEKPKRGRPAKADKAAPAKKPKQPRDKMSQSKKAPGKEASISPKPEAAPKEAKAPEQEQPAAPRDATRSAEPEQIVYINLSELHPFKNLLLGPIIVPAEVVTMGHSLAVVIPIPGDELHTIFTVRSSQYRTIQGGQHSVVTGQTVQLEREACSICRIYSAVVLTIL